METKEHSDRSPQRFVVVDDGAAGASLARGLDEEGLEVTLLTADAEAAASVQSGGIDADVIDTDDGVTLDRPAVRGADAAVVACRTDSRALLVAQYLRGHGTDRVLVFIDDPRRTDVFADAHVEPLVLSRLLATGVLGGSDWRHGAEFERAESDVGR
jgi:Trk K+ transport system NAD-binding subunit